MLKQYLLLRLRSGCRLLGSLGFIGGLCALLLLGTLILFMGNAPAYYWVLLYISLELTWHLCRRDTSFLKILFGKRYRLLYLCDYVVLTLPFIGILVYQKAWLCLPVILLLSLLVPLIPRWKIGLKLITFPFLSKGSYEYSLAGRLFLPFWLALIVASVIGVSIDNSNLVLVTLMLVTTVMGILIAQPVHITYLFNYCCFRDFILMKTVHAFHNAGIIISPFLLMQFISVPSLSQIGVTVVAGLACSLYFLQVQLLRFLCGNNGLMQMFIYIVLSALTCVAVIVPVAAIISLVVTLAMIFFTHSILKTYFQ